MVENADPEYQGHLQMHIYLINIIQNYSCFVLKNCIRILDFEINH